MSALNTLSNKVLTDLNNDPNLMRQLQNKLVSLISDASFQAMGSDQGYCFKFILKSRSYKETLQIINVTERDLLTAFTKDWGTSAMSNHMHSDPYYQTFNFLLYLGINGNFPKIIEPSLSVILYKLWNGRKTKFLQYCNKDIMNYVTNYMCNKKHLANKYSSPFELIQKYFVPTLLTKYGNNTKGDPNNLKRMFEQAYSRIRQLFISRNRTDIKTGQTVSDGGLLPLYTKAHKEGLSMAKIPVHTSGDNEVGFTDFVSSSNLDEIINTTVEKIVMNPNPNYSTMFIENLRKEYKVKRDVIVKMLKQLHNYKYHDQLHDIYSVLLKQTRINSKEDICKPAFVDSVQKNVVSSKNNIDSVQLNKNLLALLNDILQSTIQRTTLDYSNVHYIQLKKLIIRVLIYNLRQNICR